jgi:3-oxoadipate enol-lactonase
MEVSKASFICSDFRIITDQKRAWALILGGGDMQLKANGILINYEFSGREGAPVVVLSHSLGSSLVMWEPQLTALEPNFRILRYDTRGHGGSEAAAGPYSFELLARDVVGLLDGLGLSKIHFVGLSMGGMIGQALGLLHSDRLLSLILCDTAAANPPGSMDVWQERIDLVRKEGLVPLLEPTLERWFTPEFVIQNPPILEKIRRQFLATSVNGYVGCSQAIMELDYVEKLGKIQIPTLIVVGEDDPGTPVSAARAIQERIVDSKLIILPGARHLSSVEQAGAFNRVVAGFLSSI